jgi:hypothetical protein
MFNIFYSQTLKDGFLIENIENLLSFLSTSVFMILS